MKIALFVFALATISTLAEDATAVFLEIPQELRKELCLVAPHEDLNADLSNPADKFPVPVGALAADTFTLLGRTYNVGTCVVTTSATDRNIKITSKKDATGNYELFITQMKGVRGWPEKAYILINFFPATATTGKVPVLGYYVILK